MLIRDWNTLQKNCKQKLQKSEYKTPLADKGWNTLPIEKCNSSNTDYLTKPIHESQEFETRKLPMCLYFQHMKPVYKKKYCK